MKIRKAAFAAMMTLALTASMAQAEVRLFGDSVIHQRDRFSDEVVGDGPDIYFLPGLASSRETWKAVAGPLKARYRVHLLQVAGFAGEEARDNVQGPVLEPTAEALDAYFARRGPVVLIGHSLGGTIALYLAEHHPEHLKKVLIVDAVPFLPQIMRMPNPTVATVKPIADAIRANPAGAVSGAGFDRQMAYMTKDPATVALARQWAAASNPPTVANALADDMLLDLRPGLAALKVPVTLLYPDYAPMGLKLEDSDRAYQAAYAGAPVRLQRIDQSQHFIMFDQPQAFAAALDSFLKS